MFNHCIIYHSYFSSLARSMYLSFLSLSSNFFSVVSQTAKFTIRQVLFFLLTITTSLMIHLYYKRPEDFVRLIFWDGFWYMHIPFVRMVKLQFLAQFPLDHLFYPVVSSLILFCASMQHSLIVWIIILSLPLLPFIIYSIRVFHISVSWWFFTGVWVTVSLLKSPGLVSGFWPFLAILSFGWSLHVRQLPIPPGLLIIL